MKDDEFPRKSREELETTAPPGVYLVDEPPRPVDGFGMARRLARVRTDSELPLGIEYGTVRPDGKAVVYVQELIAKLSPVMGPPS